MFKCLTPLTPMILYMVYLPYLQSFYSLNHTVVSMHRYCRVNFKKQHHWHEVWKNCPTLTFCLVTRLDQDSRHPLRSALQTFKERPHVSTACSCFMIITYWGWVLFGTYTHPDYTSTAQTLPRLNSGSWHFVFHCNSLLLFYLAPVFYRLRQLYYKTQN